MGYPKIVMASGRMPIEKKLWAKNHRFCTFSTVFNFFEGHPLTLKFSKGHIRILLFRYASNGTGLIPLGPWEGQNTRFSNNFGRHVFRFRFTVAGGPANTSLRLTPYRALRAGGEPFCSPETPQLNNKLNTLNTEKNK